MTKNRIRRFFEQEKNYRRGLNVCYSYSATLEDAEDATQDVFIKLSADDERVFPEDEAIFIKYIFVAAMNHCRKMFGVRKRNNEVLQNTEEDSANSWGFKQRKSVLQKLDRLNTLIIERLDLFTVEQIKLWKCLYQCKKVNEIERELVY